MMKELWVSVGYFIPVTRQFLGVAWWMVGSGEKLYGNVTPGLTNYYGSFNFSILSDSELSWLTEEEE